MHVQNNFQDYLQQESYEGVELFDQTNPRTTLMLNYNVHLIQDNTDNHCKP